MTILWSSLATTTTDHHKVHEMSLTPPIPLASCVSKLRLFAEWFPLFARQVERVMKTCRLDLLEDGFRKRIAQLCSPEEQNFTTIYLQRHQAAFDIVRQVTTNLTIPEKDQLNVWENIGAVDSEKDLYAEKFKVIPFTPPQATPPQRRLVQALSPTARNITRRSLNEILILLSHAPMLAHQAAFFANDTAHGHEEMMVWLSLLHGMFMFMDVALSAIQKLLTGGEASALQAYLAERTNQVIYTEGQREDLADFLMRASKVAKLGI